MLGPESIMSPKKHGTSNVPVQRFLRWNVNRGLADRVCNYNRHLAEPPGYFVNTRFMRQAEKGIMMDAEDEEEDNGLGFSFFGLFFGRKKNNENNKTNQTVKVVEEPKEETKEEIKEEPKKQNTKTNGKQRKPFTFYDSNTGKPLFQILVPGGRSLKEFLRESRRHGWPSFRDDEVIWENVRCLRNGECVSLDGTHLGHNLPDHTGNRYCINLVSIAGRPSKASKAST